jgi:leader peptidase (prepilin peptidase)/N-methyltransferase
MNAIFFIAVFVFGTIVGSFLNVVILRYNTGVSFFSGRSFCNSCGKKLSWYELVPVISFFVLRRKCTGCGSKISWQYPLVELTMGLLFGATICKLSTLGGQQIVSFFNINLLLSTLYFMFMWSILVVISVYDLRHKIIPDLMVFLFAGFSLAHLAVSAGWDIFQFPYVWDLLAAPLFALPFAALWFFSRGRWMGLGDAKLALGIGWFLGLIKGGSAIILGFWMGAIVGLALIGLSKLPSRFLHERFGLRSEIPFGPFLILGVILVFFFNWSVFDLSLALF